MTIEQLYGAYRAGLREAMSMVAFARRSGLPWLLRQYRLRRSLARLGIGWEKVDAVGYRLLGPAVLLPRPGQAPLMVLDEARRAEDRRQEPRLRELRFDARSRMGRSAPPEAALKSAQRLLWVRNSRSTATERIRVELWGLLGDHALGLYDLIAPRIREQRRALDGTSGKVRLSVAYKTEALQLVARIVNEVYGATLPRPFTARDVRSRLQKRGHQADPRRHPDPNQDI